MIRRTLSVPVLVATSLAALIAGGTAYGVHAWQIGRTARSFLSHADRQEQAESWLKAAEYLDRYLQLRPEDRAARVRLARVYGQGAFTLPQKRRAVSLHYRALGSGATEDEPALRLRLSELLVETGRFPAAEEEARKFLQGDPASARAQRSLALALWNQVADGSLAGQRTKALAVVQSLVRATEANPADVDLAVVTATLYREQVPVVLAEFPGLTEPERHHHADQCLDRLVTAGGKDQRTWLARHLYRQQYDLPGAEADLAQAVKLAPDDPAVVMTAASAAYQQAQLLLQQDKQSEATVLLKQVKGYYEKLIANPTAAPRPEWYLGLGDSHLGLGERDLAISRWRKGLSHFEQPTVQGEFHARIADALLTGQEPGKAEAALDAIDEIIANLDASVPRDQRLALTQAQDLRRADWHLQRNQPLLAIPLLRQVIARLPRAETQGSVAYRACLMLGRANFSLGQWVDAAESYDRATACQPRQAGARSAAARCWLMAGRADLAVSRAEESLALQSSVQAWMALAAAELQIQSVLPPEQQVWGRLEQAIGALDQFTEEQLTDSGWRIALLRADYLTASAIALKRADKGILEAAAALEAAELKYPDVEEFRIQLIAHYEQLERAARADASLADFRSRNGDSAGPAIAAAQLAVQRKDHDRALAILDEAGRRLPTPQVERLRQLLVQISWARQDWPTARAHLLRQHEQAPLELGVIRNLADLAIEQGDFKELEHWEQKLAALRPVGEPWAGYYRALRLMLTADRDDEANLRKALVEQARISTIRPTWAEAAALKGMIEQRLGRPEQAIAAYEHAIQLGDRRVVVFEQLIALLDQANRTADCERYLSRLQSNLPLSQRLNELAATQEIKRNRPDQAVAIAQQGVTRRPDDPLARLWLGRLLIITNQPAEAKKEFERAIELAPLDVRTWNGLFSFYVRGNDRQQARETLDRLVATVKLTPAQRSFVLAQGLELLRETAEAERHYREASQLLPDSVAVQLRLARFYLQSDSPQAEPCLRKALELDPQSVVARRLLALLLASRGSADDLQQVATLLENSAENELTSSEDRRLQAILLARRKEPVHQERAVRLLEDLVERSTHSTSNDRLVLAHLYEAQAQRASDAKVAAAKFEAAGRELMAVAIRPESEPAHLAALVGFLLRRQRRNEAEVWLNKLDETLSGPQRNDPNAMAQLVQLFLDHGSFDRCEPWLDRLAKIDDQPIRSLKLRARWLAAQGRGDDARAIVEPQAEVLMAKAQNNLEKQRLYRAIGEVYEHARQYPSAENWYRKLATEDPKQFVSLANALAKQNRMQEAIELCERTMRTAPSAETAGLLVALLVDHSAGDADFRRAEPSLVQGLDQFPDNEALHYALGVLRVVQGRLDDASTHFRKVIDLNPQNSAALNNLAMLMAERPLDRKDALALIDRAIEVSGSEPDLLDTKGAILLYGGQSEKALSLLEAAARSANTDPRYSLHLAAAYRDLGDLTQARDELRLALDRQLELQLLLPAERRLLGDLKGLLTTPSTLP